MRTAEDAPEARLPRYWRSGLGVALQLLTAASLTVPAILLPAVIDSLDPDSSIAIVGSLALAVLAGSWSEALFRSLARLKAARRTAKAMSSVTGSCPSQWSPDTVDQVFGSIAAESAFTGGELPKLLSALLGATAAVLVLIVSLRQVLLGLVATTSLGVAVVLGALLSTRQLRSEAALAAHRASLTSAVGEEARPYARLASGQERAWTHARLMERHSRVVALDARNQKETSLLGAAAQFCTLALPIAVFYLAAIGLSGQRRSEPATIGGFAQLLFLQGRALAAAGTLLYTPLLLRRSRRQRSFLSTILGNDAQSPKSPADTNSLSTAQPLRAAAAVIGTDDRSLFTFEYALRPSEWLGLYGPSGCGKTTLLKTVAGFLPVLGGELQTGGDVVLIPQTPHFRPGTVLENLPDIHGRQDAVERALDTVGIEAPVRADFLLREVGFDGNMWSAGERQRLALVRALVQEPTLLLLDESTSAMDRLLEESILRRIRLTYPGMSVVLVSHRRSTLSEHCDSVKDVVADNHHGRQDEERIYG